MDTLVLEREGELEQIEALVTELAERRGRSLAIEGPGGIGKSTLLTHAQKLARSAGIRVLSAQASELEREFAFGVARQWLEPLLRAAADAERTRLLSGAAAHAGPVLLDPPRTESGGPSAQRASESAQRALYGLYWLLSTVSEQVPVLLMIDDAQWADESSLRLLNFLAARLEGAALSLLVACRPPEPYDSGKLLSRLLADPACAVIRPEALSAPGVASVIEQRLGSAPESTFLDACQLATAGNPFYVGQVVAALEREGISPTDENAERVGRLNFPDLARAVLMRLSGDARAMAQSLAVLDGPSEPSLVARVAGVEAGAAMAAIAELARAGVISEARPLRFVHAIVQSALLASLTATERAGLHAVAAEELRARGAGPEQIAVHLLEAEPGVDGQAFETLREAGAIAFARGAPGVATALLRRALIEAPGEGEQRAEVLFALAQAENEADDPRAMEHHRQAFELSVSVSLRASALLGMGWSAGNEQQAPERYLRELDEAAREVRGDQPELASALESMALMVLFLSGQRDEMGRRVERLRMLAGATPGEAALLAGSGRYLLDIGSPASEIFPVVERALACPQALETHGPHSPYLLNLAILLNHLERFDASERFAKRAIELARARGSSSGFAVASTHLARVFLMRGELREAETAARDGASVQGGRGWYLLAATSVAMHVLVEQGQLAEAQAAYDVTGLGAEIPAARPATPMLIARGAMRHAQGDLAGATTDLSAARARIDAYAAPNIAGMDARLMLVALRHEQGQTEHAREDARQCVAIARQWGTPGWLGQTLRAQGLVAGGSDGIELLREAVDSLERSQMRLEHARALVDLGAALRRGRARSQSREPLREGLAIAERAGAEPLAERARRELAASGVTVRRSGHRDRLTPSEQRIAEMAAAGSSNPQVAQALFVTVKTVESHLAGAYRKLGINSRRELPAALAAISSAR